jgi:hypothetical protein
MAEARIEPTAIDVNYPINVLEIFCVLESLWDVGALLTLPGANISRPPWAGHARIAKRRSFRDVKAQNENTHHCTYGLVSRPASLPPRSCALSIGVPKTHLRQC